MEKRNGAPWSRDEVILAMDAYKSGASPNKTDPVVLALSNLTGRTPSSVALKLANMRSIDRGKGGMPHIGPLDSMVWKEFDGRVQRLHELAEQIKSEFLSGKAGSQAKHFSSAKERNEWIRYRVEEGFRISPLERGIWRLGKGPTELRINIVCSPRGWFHVGSSFLASSAPKVDFFVFICGDSTKFYSIPVSKMIELAKETILLVSKQCLFSTLLA
ncbi:MAG: hypothetical protein M1587_07195, partial [Thaumarchaeota archaeon]|nr:hypothetical protein [Nitrososphaerota archaeon]